MFLSEVLNKNQASLTGYSTALFCPRMLEGVCRFLQNEAFTLVLQVIIYCFLFQFIVFKSIIFISVQAEILWNHR